MNTNEILRMADSAYYNTLPLAADNFTATTSAGTNNFSRRKNYDAPPK